MGATDEPQQPEPSQDPPTQPIESVQPETPAPSATPPASEQPDEDQPTYTLPRSERPYPTSYRSSTTRRRTQTDLPAMRANREAQPTRPLSTTRPLGAARYTPPPVTGERWREDSAAYRAIYRESTGKDLPEAAVPLPPPARYNLSLFLLVGTAAFFAFCMLLGLLVIFPSGGNATTQTTTSTTAIPPQHTKASNPGNPIPNVTFTKQTPAIVEPKGGGQGQPFITATPTGQAAKPTAQATATGEATATATSDGSGGTPVGAGTGN